MGVQTLKVIISYPEQTPKNMWRVLHDAEIAKLGIKPLWRPGMPEVHPLFPNHHSEFQEWAQKLSFKLNPWFANDPMRWRDIYDYKYAWANNQGFTIPGDPRADYINRLDLNEEKPRVEALLSGGMLFKAVKNGDWLEVEGLHFDTPVSYEYVAANPQFWIRGVYVGARGQVFRMLGDKYDGPPFIHPLIVNNNKGVMRLPANKAVPWTSSTPPDPLKIYL